MLIASERVIKYSVVHLKQKIVDELALQSSFSDW